MDYVPRSCDNTSPVVHSTHVEVIKRANNANALQCHSGEQGQFNSRVKVEPRPVNSSQAMKSMRLPTYEAYQRPGAMYGSVTPGLYHPLTSGSPATYSTLTTLPSSQHLLSTSYNMQTVPQTQDYFQRGGDYYDGLRQSTVPEAFANCPTSSSQDAAMEGLTMQSTMPVAPLYSSDKQMGVGDLPSSVDSGLGAELPKQDCPEDVEPFGYTTDMHSANAQRPVKPCNGLRARCGPERSAQNHNSPVRIPKILTSVGFKYTLEAPISTSVRKEEDRMTYINKGQFYTVTLEYTCDTSKQLTSVTVKSVLMVVFREEKSCADEVKSWQFWHCRQHSVKQRILEADSKNSVGIVGSIEEIAHNAVQFHWNPLERPVKISIAVQCLSTDFSNQKGVKGYPLHLQIDTFDEAQSSEVPFHRGYCQVKVFCDKGANRKMLHEQRRDEKRRMQNRKRCDGNYHDFCERSEFYHMRNLNKPAVLFVPTTDDCQQFGAVQSFYAMDANTLRTLVKYHSESENGSTPPKRSKLYPADRVMLYVRRPGENIFSPLHVVPPSKDGLLNAISEKYSIEKSRIAAVYKECVNGVTVEIDDDMVRLYCNEDSFMIRQKVSPDGVSILVTLVELDNVTTSAPPPPSSL